ncbi:LysM peptidoglycan-binding domain-containing protein [Vibrio sp. FNV 38]|nr:LysM peptidoglycan-binding domain-containing protein [Vibrio sp. FNV 38]
MKLSLPQFLQIALLSGLFVLPISASQTSPLTLKQDAPKSYWVKKGDTLWDISALYLDSPWLWPRLWQVNPDIKNPHLIYPGDRLNLIWRNGQPLLSLKPMVKLIPKARMKKKVAIPTVREELVLPYLQSDRLIELERLQQADKVVGSNDGKRYLTNRTSIYISGVHRTPRWGIYREMQTFDVRGNKVVALKKVAEAEIERNHDGITALTIVRQRQEILVGDIALNDVDSDIVELKVTFYPQPASSTLTLSILGSLEGSQYVGAHGVVVIDGGKDQKLQQGSMFELYQLGTQTHVEQSSFQLPNKLVGHLMVIRPYENYSLALITQSLSPIGVETQLYSPNHSVPKALPQKESK